MSTKPLGPELKDAITQTIVYLLRENVKEQELSRLALNEIADKKDRQASYERGMADNYSTASHLNWEADMYRLAAETRFPRADDATVNHYSQIIQGSMVELIQGLIAEDDYDHGGVTHTRIHTAIEKSVDMDDVSLVNKLIEQLAEQDLIEKSEVNFWKDEYKLGLQLKYEGEAQYQAQSIQRSEIETPKIDEITKNAMVKLLLRERIPLSLSRIEIMEMAKELSNEGSIESSWDNYSTGARLQFRASVYQLAAEARYPREGDRMVEIMRSQLEQTILDEIIYDTSHGDEAESVRVPREMLTSAICSVSSLKDIDFMNELVDEFAARGDIINPSAIKEEIKNRLEIDFQNEDNSDIQMKM
ncbi:hypothetical protein [Mesorhizobium sp. SP-1A]|uniref:hypothetical protein n=1 Tax=Mesorhizobium sp. SP-1A TaxID=3077840 RepID=UPI0028F73A5C|nr:hypothetical protein [Mesorhizobium sp. SP-1A]